MAVARQIDELQVGIAKRYIRNGDEGGEGLPAGIGRALEVAGQGPPELHDVELTVAGQVQELLSAREVRRGRHGAKLLERTESRGRAGGPDRGEVALIVPGAGLLGEHTRQALTVEIDPLVPRTVEPDRQVLEALAIDLADLLVEAGPAVVELDRWQRPGEVGEVVGASPVYRQLR